MAPTLYERIWNAINREPKIFSKPPVTHTENGVEVFNTYGDSEKGNDSPVTGVVEAPQVVQAPVLETAAPSVQKGIIGRRDALNLASVKLGAGQPSTPVHPYGQTRRRAGR